MADGYLEKKFESFGKKGRKVVIKRFSLNALLERNRSYRGYQKDHVVKPEMLERIVAVNTKTPSACNQQVLRFKLVTHDTGAEKVLENIKLGGALPELHLPFPGTEPEAFIIVCSTVEENRLVSIDLGISAQSMLLKAVEMGLNGIVIGAFNKASIKRDFMLKYDPLLIVAIGKGAETICTVPIDENESHAYYRKEGVHYVPKLTLETLLSC